MTPTELPLFEAQWWPIMLETVPGSGEALTVAIVARAARGQSSVRQVIPPATLGSMFGAAGKGMVLIVGKTVLSVRLQLDQAVSVEKIVLPYGGLHVGGMRDCVARDLHEVYDIAMRLSSAFSASNFGIPSTESPDAEARKAFEEWAEKVQSGLVLTTQQESLSRSFNVPVALTHRKKARLGFLFGDYAAQFGVLRPGRAIAADVRALKLKLFDLEVLVREKPFVARRTEIIVGYRDPGDTYTSRQRDALNESWEFVAHEAKERHVVAHRFMSANDASAYLASVASQRA
jgi:hypothetical protein